MDINHLGKAIQRAAKEKGIDPYNIPFTPKDLGIRCADYGSCSDWCSPAETTSGKYNRHICLKVWERDSRGRPHKYLLLPENKWS
jgi:hypothetical protein